MNYFQSRSLSIEKVARESSIMRIPFRATPVGEPRTPTRSRVLSGPVGDTPPKARRILRAPAKGTRFVELSGAAEQIIRIRSGIGKGFSEQTLSRKSAAALNRDAWSGSSDEAS